MSEGVANVVGSFFQCFPGSGSLTRSTINQAAGARTQWSGVISAVAVAGTMMPAFGVGMSDADVAAIAVYLRQSRTTLPPWTDVPGVVAKVRSGKTT